MDTSAHPGSGGVNALTRIQAEAQRLSRLIPRPGWPVTGVAVIAAGLALPWFAIPLQSPVPSFALPLPAAGGPAGYGAACAAAWVVAACAVVGRRRRKSAVAALAGLAVLILCTLFVVETVIYDYRLQEMLSRQASELATISQQAGFRFTRTSVKTLLFFPLPGAWRGVVAALMPGWYLCLGGGAVLLLGNWRRLAAGTRRWPQGFAIGSAVIALLLAALLLPPAVAGFLVRSAETAIRAGDYGSAGNLLTVAHAVNPTLDYDSHYTFARGRVLQEAGAVTAPLALLIQFRDLQAQRDPAAALAKVREAYRADPANAIIADQYQAASRSLARSTQDDAVLTPLLSMPRFDGPANEFTVAVLLYHSGNYSAALPHFARVLQLSQDQQVDSAAYTGLGLAERHLGQDQLARADLARALADDPGDINTLARATLLGLYPAGDL